jgi:ribosomal protein L20A (L18A)
MSAYLITWKYRAKAATESVDATSPGTAVVNLVRDLAKRLNARRRSIEIVSVRLEAEVTAETAHAHRVLAHQEAVLKKLAESPRKPPRRVTR